ncbi:MAG: hypothetical protein AAFY73_05280 [Pseudomonadota bacterium]
MSQFEMAPEAIQYALFQRTGLVRDSRSKWQRRLAELGFGKSYETVLSEQAATEADDVARRYFAEMEEIFTAMAPHIPAGTASVMDIGCGLAGLDLFAYRHLAANNPQIYLLDRTRLEDKVWYHFKANSAFYNSLALARDTLTRNGVPDGSITTIEAPEDGRIAVADSVDLIVSTASWGFHYPIDIYLDSVKSILSETGVVIVDVRKKTDGLSALQGAFSRVETIADSKKFVTVRCQH